MPESRGAAPAANSALVRRRKIGQRHQRAASRRHPRAAMSDFRTAPEFASARRHWVTSKVFEAEGFEVTWLSPAPDGRVSPSQLAEAMRDAGLEAAFGVRPERPSLTDFAAVALGGVSLNC